MNEDIYVIVADNDKPHKIGNEPFYDDGGPLVFEQYVRTADKESIQKAITSLGGRYGKCRIAKLVFLED